MNFLDVSKKSNLVVICPLYAAGEKKNPKFNMNKFASLIAKNSNTQVIDS